MPKAPKRPCRYPGCPNLCDSGVYCREHTALSSDRLRGNAAERGEKAIPAQAPAVRRVYAAGKAHARDRGGSCDPAQRQSGAVLGRKQLVAALQGLP